MSPDTLSAPSSGVQRIRDHLDARLPRVGSVWTTDDRARDRVFHAIDYVGRASTPYTTSAYELQDVQRIMASFLATAALERDAVIADLGAGDGRLTGILESHGFANIVALDIDHANAERLSARYGVDAVCADVTDSTLFPAHAFDMIVAWGLLTVLPDFPTMLETLRTWVKPGGYIITAEPTLESILLYCLVRGDTGEFQRSLATRSRAAMWDNKEHRYTVHLTRQLREWMTGNPALALVQEANVGVFPSLIAGGLVHEQGMPADERAALLDTVDFASIDGVPRQIAFLTRRVA